jgi:hypothetical protein
MTTKEPMKMVILAAKLISENFTCLKKRNIEEGDEVGWKNERKKKELKKWLFHARIGFTREVSNYGKKISDTVFIIPESHIPIVRRIREQTLKTYDNFLKNNPEFAAGKKPPEIVLIETHPNEEENLRNTVLDELIKDQQKIHKELNKIKNIQSQRKHPRGISKKCHTELEEKIERIERLQTAFRIKSDELKTHTKLLHLKLKSINVDAK